MADIEDIFEEGKDVEKICRIIRVKECDIGKLVLCKECMGKDAPNNSQFKGIRKGEICIAADIEMIDGTYNVKLEIAKIYDCPYLDTEFD
jgi:hypothetical protein